MSDNITRRLEQFAEMIGEETGRTQQIERERTNKDFDLIRRALEIQANRIAALEDQLAADRSKGRSGSASRALAAGRAS